MEGNIGVITDLPSQEEIQFYSASEQALLFNLIRRNAAVRRAKTLVSTAGYETELESVVSSNPKTSPEDTSDIARNPYHYMCKCLLKF